MAEMDRVLRYEDKFFIFICWDNPSFPNRKLAPQPISVKITTCDIW